MSTYLLELDETERNRLHKKLKRLRRLGEDTHDIDHLIDDIECLQPIDGLLIEADAGVDISKLRVITALQLPFDVVVTQQDGNTYLRETLNQHRDPDLIASVIRAMRAAAALGPLAEAVLRLHTMLSEACDSSNPNVEIITGELHVCREAIEAAERELQQIPRAA